MKKLRPNLVLDSIYDIDFVFLKKKNIKAIMVDLDGTMVSSKTPLGDEKLGNWFKSIQELGIDILVLSNNNFERVGTFCIPYNVPFLSRATKPFKRGYKKAFEMMPYKPSEVAMIGDQIYTDVFGGNRQGMYTIFIHSIDRHKPFNKTRNIFEKPFIKAKESQDE